MSMVKLGVGVLATTVVAAVGFGLAVGESGDLAVSPPAGASQEDDVLSYQGPGIVMIIDDGFLLFSPGATVLPHSQGFDLNFDEDDLENACGGWLVQVCGSLELTYDEQTSVLDVHAADESGQVFESSYLIWSDEEGVDVAANMASFFAFMHAEPRAGGGGLVQPADPSYAAGWGEPKIPPCPQGRKCCFCSFKRSCPDGVHVVCAERETPYCRCTAQTCTAVCRKKVADAEEL
jgi:hypothetical protein